MKKSLYLFLCLVLSCVSFEFSKSNDKSKGAQNRAIEAKSKENLILKPFKVVGLLWSCTPDEEPSRGGHQSHQSHSSHYSAR